RYRSVTKTLRLLMGFPIEEMNTMGALRLGTNMMRQEFTILDQEQGRPGAAGAIGADEDSIAMETSPRGEERAIYEFEKGRVRSRAAVTPLTEACGFDACYHLISGVATISAAIARVREGHVPIEPDEDLGHAANFLYMITGRRPSPLEERIMDIALILHADHGMNASTFAAMVVASTLSDIYFSVGAGIAALNGPLHGGANEQVLRTLGRIGSVEHVDVWLDEMFEQKNKISGFGHRVYKAYDPRARI
ncbi:MAG: citrate/2-methylcitrate synthase, partial [Deltaproteobacteria bacterium]|nr:citrate/2-methylcitrate synthase [Deltaproteobacteria bacterium]